MTTPAAGPPPPFDPELAIALVDVHRHMAPDEWTADAIPALRARGAAVPPPSNDELSCDGAFTVVDRVVPGPPGAPEISLLICRPAKDGAAVPAIYLIHGGGMVSGHNRHKVPQFLDLGSDIGFAVVSVEYRLAPETPHPGPVDDCYAGLTWLAAHHDAVGIDPDRIVVAGASAGGGLAAGVALLTRDLGGPKLLGQMLMCPMIDDRNESLSAHQMAGLGLFDRSSSEAGWTALLGSARGGADVSPYAAASRATDLAGLAPAFVDVGSAETFRDEAVDYASRIWAAGGVAELHVWAGAFHGFDGVVPEARVSRDAWAARRAWLRRVLQTPPSETEMDA